LGFGKFDGCSSGKLVVQLSGLRSDGWRLLSVVLWKIGSVGFLGRSVCCWGSAMSELDDLAEIVGELPQKGWFAPRHSIRKLGGTCKYGHWLVGGNGVMRRGVIICRECHLQACRRRYERQRARAGR
jgi:hypothetical protein